jgi:hypothetical protein
VPDQPDFVTEIQGRDRDWTPEIWALWRVEVEPALGDPLAVVWANYFRDEPYEGHTSYGFAFGFFEHHEGPVWKVVLR